MPTLAEAITTKNLLLVRDVLADEVENCLRRASPGLVASCTMVCLMWSTVLASAAPGIEESDSIARCMLVDALALLERA